jgi:hypothetical protein
MKLTVDNVKDIVSILKVQRDNGILEPTLDATILFHIYRTLFASTDPEVIEPDQDSQKFESADEAMIFLTLFSYLLDSVKPENCRSFMAHLVRRLHVEICDHSKSRIDAFLGVEHYQKLLEIVSKLGALDSSYYVKEVDNPEEHIKLLIACKDLLQVKIHNYTVLNNY